MATQTLPNAGSAAGPTADSRSIPDSRARLAFDASFEITSLSGILRRLICDANLDELGKACCGMLIRIEQLSEAINACVDEDPVRSYGMDDQALRRLVLGHAPQGSGHG